MLEILRIQERDVSFGGNGPHIAILRSEQRRLPVESLEFLHHREAGFTERLCSVILGMQLGIIEKVDGN